MSDEFDSCSSCIALGGFAYLLSRLFYDFGLGDRHSSSESFVSGLAICFVNVATLAFDSSTSASISFQHPLAANFSF